MASSAAEALTYGGAADGGARQRTAARRRSAADGGEIDLGSLAASLAVPLCCPGSWIEPGFLRGRIYSSGL